MMAKQDNLDLQTRDLVRFAAAVAQGYEPELRERVTDLRLSQVPAAVGRGAAAAEPADGGVPPRADRLHGLAQGRASSRPPESDPDQDYSRAPEWTRRGEELCAVVYGENYRKLRESVQALHPAVDSLDGHRGLRPHAGASRPGSQAA